jgi:ribosomal protein L28
MQDVFAQSPAKGRQRPHHPPQGLDEEERRYRHLDHRVTRRTFRPNVQRVRVRMPNGQVKRIWVSAKALKAGKVQKA